MSGGVNYTGIWHWALHKHVLCNANDDHFLQGSNAVGGWGSEGRIYIKFIQQKWTHLEPLSAVIGMLVSVGIARGDREPFG